MPAQKKNTLAKGNPTRGANSLLTNIKVSLARAADRPKYEFQLANRPQKQPNQIQDEQVLHKSIKPQSPSRLRTDHRHNGPAASVGLFLERIMPVPTSPAKLKPTSLQRITKQSQRIFQTSGALCNSSSACSHLGISNQVEKYKSLCLLPQTIAPGFPADAFWRSEYANAAISCQSTYETLHTILTIHFNI